ncbi:MAG: hypothetical protein ACHQJ7_09650 [Vicinamibacteria bacterium]
MTTAILVVGTGAASVAAARFPRALTQAGASVSLFCPSNAHARHTRHVARVGVVSPESPPSRWIEALFALVDVALPRAIAPADERALDLLIALATTPPAALRPERAAALADLLAASLGPLDLVAARRDPVEAIAAPTNPPPVAALDARVLAPATAEHVVVDTSARPRPTVLRFCAHDGIASLAEHAVRDLRASGCLSLDVAVAGNGAPRIVGVDRHVVASMHVSQWLGVDLGAAWLAALEGREYAGATTLPASTSRHSVAFPQEWDRDRASPWLREQRVDVPWDDPELLDAILADAMGGPVGR